MEEVNFKEAFDHLFVMYEKIYDKWTSATEEIKENEETLELTYELVSKLSKIISECLDFIRKFDDYIPKEDKEYLLKLLESKGDDNVKD